MKRIQKLAEQTLPQSGMNGNMHKDTHRASPKEHRRGPRVLRCFHALSWL